MLTMEMNNFTILFFTLAMVLFVSNNCNGLRDVNKFKKYVSIFDDRKIDFLCLQETFWDEDFIVNIDRMYDGCVFYSNGNNKRQGVAILVNKKYKENVKEIFVDKEGRFVHVEFEYEGCVYNVFNIYAHNSVNEKCEFFKFIDDYLKSYENIIIAGDWNTTLSKLDRASKTVHKDDMGYNSLCNLMITHDIYDIWRSRNPLLKTFSWKRICDLFLQQSRIDYFLLSRDLSQFVQYVNYKDTSLSDHSFVELKVIFDHVERGPGVWILNNTLLDNEDFITNIYSIIEEGKKCPLFEENTLIWWDNLKYKIKKYSQVFGKRIAKEKNAEYFCLQNKLQRLCMRIADGENVNVEKYENLKYELSILEEEKCRGAILRSKAFWATENDKCTKYFLNLEKHRQENNCIKELYDCSDGSFVSDTNGLLNVQYKFYEKLYSCVETDTNAMDELLQNIKFHVEKSDVEICDSDITDEELFAALHKMSKNKSPGSDGLTVEFYCKFYPVLKDILLKLFNAVENCNTLSRSMRNGVLSLIYKKKGDKRDLKNYRPISLLQVDYKILARIMSNRFKLVLCNIISDSQTCCIPGRDIADTIASVRDVIYMVNDDDLEGYILKFDQEKAFDRVCHNYLFRVLESFGFGNRFVNWIRIFYNDIQSTVKCNGFLTKYFKIRNGIRQGCPISALLYVLSAEPLSLAIRNHGNIHGIQIPFSNATAVLFQHADDTTLCLSDKQSIKSTFEVFNLYNKASGSKINISKSEILCIGKGFLSESEKNVLGLRVCEKCIQVLGVYVGIDEHLCNDMNWKDKIKKIKCIVNMWKQRHLTLTGRAVVISSLLVSRIWYVLAVSSIPNDILNELKQICINFLWDSKSHLIKYDTVIGTKHDGGLNFQDIFLKLLSLRLKFLGRFLSSDCVSFWKSTFAYFLRRVHCMNLTRSVFFLSLDKKSLLCLPQVYREMLDAWQLIKNDTTCSFEIGDVYIQPLYYNRMNNLSGRKWECFIQAGIVQIKDICYEVIPGFLPTQAIFDVIKEKNSDVSYKYVKDLYMMLLNSIPAEWKTIVLKNCFSRNDQLSDFYVKLNGKVCNISLCQTKRFYQLFLQKVFIKPNCYEFWSEHCNSHEKEFAFVWKQVHSFWKPSECIDLDFKLCHNRLFTNVKLCRIGIIDSAVCQNCNSEDEDLFHMLLSCDLVIDFHDFLYDILEKLFIHATYDVLRRFNYQRLFLLGLTCKCTGVNVHFVNFLLSIGRLCIMKQRQMIKHGTSNVNLIVYFKYTLKHYISYFHAYCKMQNRLSVFEKMFLRDNTILSLEEDVLLFLL